MMNAICRRELKKLAVFFLKLLKKEKQGQRLNACWAARASGANNRKFNEQNQISTNSMFGFSLTTIEGIGILNKALEKT